MQRGSLFVDACLYEGTDLVYCLSSLREEGSALMALYCLEGFLNSIMKLRLASINSISIVVQGFMPACVGERDMVKGRYAALYSTGRSNHGEESGHLWEGWLTLYDRG
jgi:hypothetical protein